MAVPGLSKILWSGLINRKIADPFHMVLCGVRSNIQKTSSTVPSIWLWSHFQAIMSSKGEKSLESFMKYLNSRAISLLWVACIGGALIPGCDVIVYTFFRHGVFRPLAGLGTDEMALRACTSSHFEIIRSTNSFK